VQFALRATVRGSGSSQDVVDVASNVPASYNPLNLSPLVDVALPSSGDIPSGDEIQVDVDISNDFQTRTCRLVAKRRNSDWIWSNGTCRVALTARGAMALELYFRNGSEALVDWTVFSHTEHMPEFGTADPSGLERIFFHTRTLTDDADTSDGIAENEMGPYRVECLVELDGTQEGPDYETLEAGIVGDFHESVVGALAVTDDDRPILRERVVVGADEEQFVLVDTETGEIIL
jgi:hypothetical protein